MSKSLAWPILIALIFWTCSCNREKKVEQAELRDLPVLASAEGVLDLLMIARPKPIELANLRTVAWVYEICPRRDAINDQCPLGSNTYSPYGGVRLQLQPGDHLKLRLVNRLPPAPPDSEFAQRDESQLRANPTNLHTHGLLVEPRESTKQSPAYGDYVFVLGYGSGNMPRSKHAGLKYSDQPIEYDIAIPRNHPAGLYWFHPHVHGLNLNQISAGLSGVLTIGSVSSYATRTMGGEPIRTRDLMLKDTQILRDGTMITQQESEFCVPEPFPGEAARLGYCSQYKEGALHQDNGKWFFTINGQLYPKITMDSGAELWRLVNASGGRTYDLVLRDVSGGNAWPMQIAAVDGISLNVPTGATLPPIAGQLGETAVPEWCDSESNGDTRAVCTKALHVLPGARVEVWVRGTSGSSGVLVASKTNMGPRGDIWPEVQLATINVPRSVKSEGLLVIHGSAESVYATGGILSSVSSSSASYSPPRSDCPALQSGHIRRIFMGTPQHDRDSFGLGYEELDTGGEPVAGTFRDIAEFDHHTVTACVPLARGTPTKEVWELVNVSGEDHNFHIHQTKFRVLDRDPTTQRNVLLDNVPVPHGSEGCDGTIAAWRSGSCHTSSIRIEIPFTEAGDFVYHCHILEHEDAGMMARIRVIRKR